MSLIDSESSLYPPTSQERPQSRIGPAPPLANAQNSTVSVPRTYHQLVNEFETLRYIYYAASISTCILPLILPPSAACPELAISNRPN